MNFNKAKQTFGILALAGITLPAAVAEPQGWYLGASAGESRADIAEQEIKDTLQQSGFTTTDFREDDSDFGYKLLGGYQFNRHFALETSFFDLGEFSYKATTQPQGSEEGELDLRGWSLDLLTLFPISERASLFARGGVHNSEAVVHFTGTGAVNVANTRDNEHITDYKMGVGFQYNLNDALALRIEAERYRIDDTMGSNDDLDLYSVGVVYYLSTATATPAPRAQEQAPAPSLVVAPLPGATEEYCSLLDIQFEIGQEDIQREEFEKLAVVATYLQRYPKTSAVIEGHTDNVGDAAGNMKLSQQRADSVVQYFVREHRIDRSRLRAVGHGETRPIADNRTQAGKRANRRIATIIGCATDIAGLEPLPARITLAMQIDFDTNSATVKSQYRNELSKVAKFLAENPKLTATMEGHADNTSPGTAQSISRQRAQSVANYLVEQLGVDRTRLKVQGFGETRRFAYNTSAEGRQENRRVNIILGYPD